MMGTLKKFWVKSSNRDEILVKSNKFYVREVTSTISENEPRDDEKGRDTGDSTEESFKSLVSFNSRCQSADNTAEKLNREGYDSSTSISKKFINFNGGHQC